MTFCIIFAYVMKDKSYARIKYFFDVNVNEESYLEIINYVEKSETRFLFCLICRFFEKFWLGCAATQTPRVFLAGGVLGKLCFV